MPIASCVSIDVGGTCSACSFMVLVRPTVGWYVCCRLRWDVIACWTISLLFFSVSFAMPPTRQQRTMLLLFVLLLLGFSWQCWWFVVRVFAGNPAECYQWVCFCVLMRIAFWLLFAPLHCTLLGWFMLCFLRRRPLFHFLLLFMLLFALSISTNCLRHQKNNSKQPKTNNKSWKPP